jgi:hypothetical protein
LQLPQIRLFLVVPPFLFQASADARFEQHRIHCLEQIVLGTHLDALDHTAHLVKR